MINKSSILPYMGNGYTFVAIVLYIQIEIKVREAKVIQFSTTCDCGETNH